MTALILLFSFLRKCHLLLILYSFVLRKTLILLRDENNSLTLADHFSYEQEMNTCNLLKDSFSKINVKS